MTNYAERDVRAPEGRAVLRPRPGRCVIQRCKVSSHIGMMLIPEDKRDEMRVFNTIAKVLAVGAPLKETDKEIEPGQFVFIRPTPNHIIEEVQGDFPVEVMAFDELLSVIEFIPYNKPLEVPRSLIVTEP